MTEPERLARLAQLAALVKDSRIADFARAERRRLALETQLQQLDGPRARTGLDPVTEALAGDVHDLWKAGRRMALNEALARETAAAMRAREAASVALHRVDMLNRMGRRGR